MENGFLTTLTHRAMATDFAVMLPSGDGAAADAVLESLEMLDRIEAAMTIYQPESEICRVNDGAANGPVAVSPMIFDVLKRAIHWSQQTDGAFDVTAGPLVEAWGFTKRTGQKPPSEQIAAARRRVGYQHLILDDAKRTVTFAVDGMSINLGGIGKGYALDCLAETLVTRGVENFLIHGGQSSVIARGDQEPDSGQGWAIGISHPTKPHHRIAGIRLRNLALGTSGSGKQFFHHQGRRYGHVIDPRTGYPAGDLLALTVLTPSAADADASATGYFVCGFAEIEKLHASQAKGDPSPTHENGPGPMLAVVAGGRQDAVELQAFGDIDWVGS